MGSPDFYLGLIFPVSGLVLDIWFCKGQALSAQNILLAHQSNYLHFVIDLAPFILGITFYYIGLYRVRLSLQKKRVFELLNNGQKARHIQHIESLLELSEASIFSINTSWEYLLLNKEHQDYMQKRFGVIVHKGDNIKDILEMQGSPAKTLLNQLSLAMGKNHIEATERERYSNKSDQYFESRYSAMLDDKGFVIGVNAFRQNITARRTTFVEAQENQHILNGILNHLPVVIYKADTNGSIILSEGSALSNVGLKPNELVGTNLFQRMPRFALHFQRAQKGEMVKFTAEGNTNNKDWFFENYIFHNPDEDGGIMGVAVDVSKTYKAEAKSRHTETTLQAVIENTTDTVWSLDNDMRYTVLNKSFTDMMETLSGKRPEIGDKFDFALLPYDTAAQWAAAYKRAYEGERFITEATIHLTNHTLIFEHAYNPLKDINGKITGITAFGRNITRRKESEIALVKARLSAEEATLTKARFLSVLSHEIRTPLHSVIGFINLLQSDKPQPHQQEYLQSLKFSAGHLHELLTSVLDFSKLEEGKAKFEQVEFDFNQLLSDVADLFKPKASEKNLALRILPHKPIMPPLLGDALRLKQVLSNLLSNAVKFTDKGSISLEYQVVWETLNHIRIRINVTDTGIGIPRNKQGLLFDRFIQVHDIDVVNEGSGLGLSICKTIVEAQGGRIGINSLPGEGSTFYFELSFERPASNQSFCDRTYPARS